MLQKKQRMWRQFRSAHFPRPYLKRVGRFDESLLSNEDYEFNTRIHLNGGKVWLDPRIHSRYFARKNLKQLARQYWRYGFWKLKMLKRYPKTIRWRQAIPPLFVFGILLFTILSVFLEFCSYNTGMYSWTISGHIVGFQFA